jgi:hypothetical protein
MSTSNATATATTASKAVSTTRDAVLAERATLESWEAKHAAAEAELAALERLAGDSILAEPDDAEKVEGKIADARRAVRAAARAIEAQGPRVPVAEARYFAAEADALDAERVAAQRVLDEHDAKTEKLLRQLEEHEGAFVPEVDLIKVQHQAGTGPNSWKAPKSAAMRSKVRTLGDQVTILRELAAGRDPEVWIRANRYNVISGKTVEYPECVAGPDALVSVPAFLTRTEGARTRLRELEELLDELPRRLEERAQAIRLHQPNMDVADDYVWARLQARLKDLPDELAIARRECAAILGDQDDDLPG